MGKTVYEKLLSQWEEEGSLPPGMNDVVAERLESWITEKEGMFLLGLSSAPQSRAAIAENQGMTEEECQLMLDNLMEKAMVVDVIDESSKGERLYKLASWIVWLENYFHRYVDLNDPNPREIDIRLSRWLEDLKKSDRFQSGRAKYFRVVPLEKAIHDDREAVSFLKASRIIQDADYVSVMRCACRAPAHLIGEDCDNPLEVCFSLDDYARYQVEHGYARQVTKEWAVKTIEECEKRGLIHLTNNIKGCRTVLCNCCSCHCLVMTGYTHDKQVSRAAKSDFIMSVDVAECDGCGVCVKKCPYHALGMEREKARVDETRCIGCGTCMPSCPTGALALKERPAQLMEKRYESMDEYVRDLED